MVWTDEPLGEWERVSDRERRRGVGHQQDLHLPPPHVPALGRGPGQDVDEGGRGDLGIGDAVVVGPVVQGVLGLVAQPGGPVLPASLGLGACRRTPRSTSWRASRWPSISPALTMALRQWRSWVATDGVGAWSRTRWKSRRVRRPHGTGCPDDLGGRLSAEMRRAMGCSHGPGTPPAPDPRDTPLSPQHGFGVTARPDWATYLTASRGPGRRMVIGVSDRDMRGGQ